MAASATAYLGVGSNLGDRSTRIKNALAALDNRPDTKLLRSSRIVQTRPLAGLQQPDYLNTVVEVQTTLDPSALLQALKQIEKSLGRAPSGRWQPRTIDLDILLYEDRIINTPELTIPHPQMHLRSFVLTGLCELVEELIHPVLQQPVSQLAARLNGADFYLNPQIPQLFCIAGVIGVGKTTLAKALAEALPCELLLEAYDTNPFLAHVYAGQKQLALDCQLYFLMSRIEQLHPNRLSSGKAVVADYVFDKELIYARRLLDECQYSLYRKIYDVMLAGPAEPVLAIYLHDLPENCLARIRSRSRPYETDIQPDFLRRLSEDYDKLFAEWRRCPLIRLDARSFDCTDSRYTAGLAEEIKSYIATPE